MDLVERAQRAGRDPKAWARLQSVGIGVVTFGVIAAIEWGDWLSWAILADGVLVLGLSVPGEVRARRWRREEREQ
jgi:hypothetical protein